MKDNSELQIFFEANGGYLQTKWLNQNRTLFSQLKSLVENGEVEKVKPGLYRRANIFHSTDWEEIGKIVPDGILCLQSAWQYHELTTHISPKFHVAIPHKKKLVLPEYPPIKLYHWSTPNLEIGKTLMNGFQIFDMERSVCDAIRFRKKIGQDMATEVLKTYLKRKDRNLDKLLRYASKLRILKVLQTYLDINL